MVMPGEKVMMINFLTTNDITKTIGSYQYSSELIGLAFDRELLKL